MSVCISSCQNETLGKEIMSAVNSTLANSSYHLVSGRVISGQEEAVAGWITANSLGQHLKHPVSPTHTVLLGNRHTK